MYPAGFTNASVAVNATSMTPSSGLTDTSCQPSVAAAAGSGVLPSTASQNGPVRSTAHILTGTADSTRRLVVAARRQGRRAPANAGDGPDASGLATRVGPGLIRIDAAGSCEAGWDSSAAGRTRADNDLQSTVNGDRS